MKMGATNYYISGSIVFNRYLYELSSEIKESQSDFCAILDEAPVVVSLQYELNGEITEMGHVILIYDYHTDSITNELMFDIYDPWEPGVGSEYSLSYTDLVSRTEISANGSILTTSWNSTLAYNVGPYEDYILVS